MLDAQHRIIVAVLYGGISTEHEVSIMSATNVMAALSPDRYRPVPVYITRDGRWLQGHYSQGVLSTPASGRLICPLPGGRGKCLILDDAGAVVDSIRIDILLPVLHGLGGEDGSVQGLAEVAGMAFVGCGVLGSAACLDKDATKRLLGSAGIPVARSRTLTRLSPVSFEDAAAELGVPVFVKPARQGSSVGVNKASDKEEFRAAVEAGFRHDAKLLVEEFVPGREIECSVLQSADGTVFVSRPGEIVPKASHGFYTYEAKYVDAGGADIVVPALLDPAVESRIRELAEKTFRALECEGMARVDFFLTGEGNVLVNEVNTIPGFTNISMYPKALEASGVSYGAILDRLIEHGLARAGQRSG